MIQNKYKSFIGSSCQLPTHELGRLRVESIAVSDAVDGDLMVIFGDALNQSRPTVRIHSECAFAEVFGSKLCDCADQLQDVLALFKKQGGILFYLRIDGRGAGLAAKVAATKLEVDGVDTWESRIHIGVKPESRSFVPVGKILKSKDIKRITLLTNNPDKVSGIEDCDIDVERQSLYAQNPTKEVEELYKTKKEKFNHNFS